MSIYRIPEQDPVPWCREGRYGEGGTWGIEMDASGLETRNRIMYRDTVPTIPNVSYLVRVRLQSTLVASNNGFEGFAVRMRGFILEGSDPDEMVDRQVWDSNPSQGGKKRWLSTQTTGYETRAFILEDVPEGLDYVTLEVVVRASGGQVRIHNIECRHLFQTTRDFQRTGYQSLNTASLWNYEEVPVIRRDGIDNQDDKTFAYVNYLNNESITIVKGQRIEVVGTAFILGGIKRNDNTVLIEGAELNLYIKFKVKEQDRYHMASIESQPGRSPIIRHKSVTLTEEALENYENYQYVIGLTIEDDSVDETNTTPYGAYGLIGLSLRVTDFTRPSQ